LSLLFILANYSNPLHRKYLIMQLIDQCQNIDTHIFIYRYTLRVPTSKFQNEKKRKKIELAISNPLLTNKKNALFWFHLFHALLFTWHCMLRQIVWPCTSINIDYMEHISITLYIIAVYDKVFYVTQLLFLRAIFYKKQNFIW
jgi:hypothetical protein